MLPRGLIGADRAGELAVVALRGMVLSREDVRISKASFEQLVSRLHALGLDRENAIKLAEWLVADVTKTMFDMITADDQPAPPPPDGPSGPPPSDDDIPF